MSRTTGCTLRLILATVVATLSACADVTATTDHVATPADSAARPGTLAKLRVVSGDSQSASLSAPVPLLLQVRATDALGNPLAGVRVTFAVASGGGVISGSPALTDDSGVAASSAWTLGSAEGPQHVIARAAGYEELMFTAFARPVPPSDPPELSAGERLVYVRNGAIWEATDSQQRLLLQPADGIYAAAVSRDGSIAFVTGTTNQVCIAALGESEPRCVGSGYYNINGLAWSPNGTQLAFSGQPVLSTCSATPPCFAPRMELLAVDATTMIVRPVVVDVPGIPYALGASWSPDGSVIAFANRGGIWLVNADGSELRELKSHVGGSYAVMGVRWSPDGRKFSVSLWDESQCPWYCDSAVGVVDADGSGLRVVATARVATDHFVGGWPHSAPVWSPDGQRIAFGRTDCSSGWDPCREDESVVDANGGTAKPLLENGTLLAWHER